VRKYNPTTLNTLLPSKKRAKSQDRAKGGNGNGSGGALVSEDKGGEKVRLWRFLYRLVVLRGLSVVSLLRGCVLS
jgi:hypothetical protein